MFAVGKIWMCWYILCNYLNLICDGLASSIIVILNYAIKCIQNPIITWYILRSSANLRSGIQLVGHSIGQLWNQAAAALSLCRPTTNWHFLPAIFYVSVPNRNKSLSLHSGKSEPRVLIVATPKIDMLPKIMSGCYFILAPLFGLGLRAAEKAQRKIKNNFLPTGGKHLNLLASLLGDPPKTKPKPKPKPTSNPKQPAKQNRTEGMEWNGKERKANSDSDS